MRNYFWGFILIVMGTLLLLDHLGALDFGNVIHDYWPLILIFWGLSMFAGRRRNKNEPTVSTDQNPGQGVDYDLLHQSSVFGDIHTNVTSSHFKGGSVSTVVGNTLIDLSKSTFDLGEHPLRLHGVFGDTTLILPKDAAVSITAHSVLGGLTILGQRKEGMISDVRMATPNYESAPSRLKISIHKVFGNVNVS
jgi:predicted membrane protein